MNRKPVSRSSPATEMSKLLEQVAKLHRTERPTFAVSGEVEKNGRGREQKAPHDDWEIERNLAILAVETSNIQSQGLQRVLSINYLHTTLLSALYLVDTQLEAMLHDPF